jgi:hypothetical protein
VRKKDFDGAGGAGRLGFLFMGLRLGVHAVGRMDWGLLPSLSGDHSGISPRPLIRGRGGGGEGVSTQGRVGSFTVMAISIYQPYCACKPSPPTPLPVGRGEFRHRSHLTHPTSLLAQARASRGALGVSARPAGKAVKMETFTPSPASPELPRERGSGKRRQFGHTASPFMGKLSRRD